ncbi:MAG: pilus assembly protein TadG-related protein, partial [Acidobacteria bacterium]|nr:pilus assembly protein TadG-related protein [Acidobacteriota bacterium]
MCASRPRKAKQRGFSLLMTACCAVVMVGMLGLTFDVGRMFITKNELQTFTDAAALAATAALTGAKSGVQSANQVALTGPLGTSRPNAVSFETSRITNVTTAFGTSLTGTFDSYATASGPGTNTYRFVRVTATSSVPFYFLPVLPNVASQQTLSATATAGQQGSNGFGYGGLEPFSPAAHTPADTQHFGFIPGQQYTLKWGNGNTTTCAGDSGFNPGNKADQHDFVDIGQETNGNGTLREVIEFGGYPNPTSNPSVIVPGTSLKGIPGNRGAGIFDALSSRSLQDPDQTSTTYEQYLAAGHGNGRRIVSAAIHDPAQNSGNGNNFRVIVIGFGNFLIDPGDDISGSSGPICATY